MTDPLNIERGGPIMRVTLNRPNRMNALSVRLVEELWDTFRALEDDLTTRVVVLTGRGRAFCAGLDFKERLEHPEKRFPRGLGRDGVPEASLAGIIRAMRRCPQPIIAAVNGPAFGGGLALAAAADIRLASTLATFGNAFIARGASGCEMGLSFFLPKIVGLSHASEVLYTGDPVTADRAKEINLVSSVSMPAALDQAAQDLADRMLKSSELGLRKTKETLNRALQINDLDAVLELEDRTQGLCIDEGLFAEGLKAFQDARKPAY